MIGILISNTSMKTPILSISNDSCSTHFNAVSNWSNATVISDLYGWNLLNSYHPSIAIDSNNNLHVVWDDFTNSEWGTDSEIFYINNTGSGWSNATAISDLYGWNDGESSYPDIAVDKNNNLHVVWEDDTDGEWGTDKEIFYITYTGSSWSNATVISDLYGWNDKDCYHPMVAVDNNDNLHVVWWDYTSGEWGADTEIFYVNGSVVKGQQNNSLGGLILFVVSKPNMYPWWVGLIIGIIPIVWVAIILLLDRLELPLPKGRGFMVPSVR